MKWGYYFNGYQTLTYDTLFNFIIGNRGSGKSFWAKYWAINDFIKRKKQFIYVRRYSREMKKLKNFFSDIREFFPDHTFEVKGMRFYIDGMIAGEAMVLATSKIEKSVSFPDVNKIIFDEFIIDKGVYHYLPNEVEYFLDLYETIARMRDVPVFFIANAITQTNPYFLYFQIELPYNKDIQVFYNDGTGNFTSRRVKEKADILIQLVANQSFIDKKKDTRFGQLIGGTKYFEYAVENTFLRDSNEFIAKKGEGSKFKFSIEYEGRRLGIWVNYDLGIYTISPDYDPSSKLIYSFTTKDHKVNTLLISSINRSVYLKSLFDNFKIGNVRFENVDMKNLFYDLARLISF